MNCSYPSASQCNRCSVETPKTRGHYNIENKLYCLACGRKVNEERKDELLQKQYQELFFGEEM